MKRALELAEGDVEGSVGRGSPRLGPHRILQLYSISLVRNTPVQANTPVHAIKLPACPAVAWDARADLAGSLGDLVASR